MTPGNLFICLLFLFAACTSRPVSDHPYTTDGLTMNLPPYWNVVPDGIDTAISADRVIAFINKDPQSKGASLAIWIENDTSDIKVNLQTVVNVSRNRMTKLNIPFQLLKTNEAILIGTKHVLRARFKCEEPGHPTLGIATVFRMEGKTYHVIYMTCDEINPDNTALIDKIIRSMKKFDLKDLPAN
ncbi:hypothetical protein [Chitinophaga sp.]|uniref:hypothetical protein n=1 Tax=Chitinophaga sp. TaxID=1869181 RepID=UPI002F95A99B